MPKKKKNPKQSENNKIAWGDIKFREMDQTLPNWYLLKSQDFISFHKMKNLLS